MLKLTTITFTLIAALSFGASTADAEIVEWQPRPAAHFGQRADVSGWQLCGRPMPTAGTPAQFRNWWQLLHKRSPHQLHASGRDNSRLQGWQPDDLRHDARVPVRR